MTELVRMKEINAKVITEQEFVHYRQQANIKFGEENQSFSGLKEERKKEAIECNLNRKDDFFKLKLKELNKKNRRLTEIREESRKRAMHLVERAAKLKLEQAEEIQKCNRLILETKCRIVRDAQIAEKKLIKRELEEAEQHLNAMMENEKNIALKAEAQKEKEEMIKRREFADALLEQIRRNEEQRILEMRKKQEESRLLNHANIARQSDEIVKLENEKKKAERIRQEFIKSNEELKRFKELEREENRIMDMRIKEAQRVREEREKEIMEKQRLEKLKQEQGKDKVALNLQTALNLKSQINEMNAARIQEEVDREWRRKEKAESIRVAKNGQLLKISREEQSERKLILQALEMKRDEEQFKRIVEIQKQAVKKQEEEKRKKLIEKYNYREAILKQIEEKDRIRIRNKQEKFQENIKMRKEEEMRNKRISELMREKCAEMRKNSVPESYIREVTRKMESLNYSSDTQC